MDVKKCIERRGKGAGTLVNKRGKWAMRWREGGRLIQESTPFRVDVKADRKKALDLLSERTEALRLRSRRNQLAVMIAEREDIEAKLKKMQAAMVEEVKPVTVGELAERFRESPRRRDSSEEQLGRYLAQIGAFAEWAGADVDLRAVDDVMAERYAKELGKNRSGSSYNKHLNALTAAWKAVGPSVGVRGNPWADLPRKRLETHVRRALTEAEVGEVLKVAEGEIRGLILIGLHTGLRMGDACRLKWDAFKADGSVEVETGKTGAMVRLPAGRLRMALGKKGKGLVLPEVARIYERDPARVSKLVMRAFERAGIKTRANSGTWGRARPDASFHSLRHTFVTRAIEAGVPSAIVRALVGHSTMAMTEHYTHVGAAAVLEAFTRAGI